METHIHNDHLTNEYKWENIVSGSWHLEQSKNTPFVEEDMTFYYFSPNSHDESIICQVLIGELLLI